MLAAFIASLAVPVCLPGAAAAQQNCPEGVAANGECVNAATNSLMRQTGIIFSQPKISYTAYPVLPGLDLLYRYPYQLNPPQQQPAGRGCPLNTVC
jgi:hypothetical protein